MNKSIKIRTVLPNIVNPNTNQNVKAGDFVPLWSLDSKGNWTQKSNAVVVNNNGSLTVEANVIDGLSSYNWDYIGYAGNGFPNNNLLSFNSSFSQVAVDGKLRRSVVRSGNGLGSQVSLISPQMYDALMNFSGNKVHYVEDNEVVPTGTMGYNIVFEVRNNNTNSNYPVLSGLNNDMVQDLGQGVTLDTYDLDKFINNFTDFKINSIKPGMSIVVKFKLKRANVGDLVSEISFSTAKLVTDPTLPPSPTTPVINAASVVTSTSTNVSVNAGPDALTYYWSVVGPQSTLITQSTSPSTFINFNEAGYYVVSVVVSYSNKPNTISYATIYVQQTVTSVVIEAQPIVVGSNLQTMVANGLDQFGNDMALDNLAVTWTVNSVSGPLPTIISPAPLGVDTPINNINSGYASMDESTSSSVVGDATALMVSPSEPGIYAYTTSASVTGDSSVKSSNAQLTTVTTLEGINCIELVFEKPYVFGNKLGSIGLNNLPQTLTTYVPQTFKIGNETFNHSSGTSWVGENNSSVVFNTSNGQTNMIINIPDRNINNVSLPPIIRYREFEYDFVTDFTNSTWITEGRNGVWAYRNDNGYKIYNSSGAVVPGPQL